MDKRVSERRPAEVFHPGEHLLDELNAREWTQTEFAEIIGRPLRLVNEIINCKKGITPETAREIGAALGTSAEFWLNLNMAYDLWKLNEDVTQISHRARLRSQYPVRDMALRGWLRYSEDSQVMESQLFRYFEIKSLDEQPKLVFAPAHRRSHAESEELNPIQIAWLYRVKQLAAGMQVPQYSKNSLRDALVQLAALMIDPEKIRQVPQILERCGVRFVVVEPLPASKIDGVTFWIDSSPVIGMSLRFDRIDNFWFVLRHEIEHVLNEDGKESAIVDSDLYTMDTESVSKQEQIANFAAAEFCIPQKKLDDFVARNSPLFSRKIVLVFAAKLRIHPGLVVGQLQKRLGRYDLFRPFLVPIRSIITMEALTDGYGHFISVEK